MTMTWIVLALVAAASGWALLYVLRIAPVAAGYKAKVSLREGIDRMVKWYLREGRNIKPVWHLPPAQVTASTG